MTKDINDFLGRMQKKHDKRAASSSNDFDGKVSNDHSTTEQFMDYIDSPNLR